MSNETDLRRQAQSMLDALALRLTESVRTDLEGLKVAVDNAVVAVHGTLSHANDGAGLDALVQEAVKAGREEAQAAARQARREADQRAAKELAEVRAAAEVQSAAAQAVNADLLSNLDNARRHAQEFEKSTKAEIDRARKELDTARRHLQEIEASSRAEIDRAGKELDETRQALDEARRAIQEAQAAAHAEFERTRLALESRLTEAQEERRSLSEREERLTEDLAMSAERVRSLEETTRKLFAESRARATLQEKHAQTTATSLDAVGSALQAVYGASSARDLFEALLDHLSRHFDKAAVFIVGSNSVRPWQVRGLPAERIKELTIPRAIDSLLARAVSDREPVMLTADRGGEPPMGLLNSPITSAMALPIVSHDRVKAVAYVEAADAPSTRDTYKVAEVLVSNANKRLSAAGQAPMTATYDSQSIGYSHGVQAPSGASQDGPWTRPREARRVRMEDVVNVTLDGSASFLIDLSALGAQVLSPIALRPNGVIRMTVLVGQQTLACKCRVVWASLEQQQGMSATLYRAGLQFTETDPHLVEAFLSGRQMPSDRPSNVIEMPVVRN